MGLPILVPVRVPWEIDPATPYLRLIANEGPEEYQTEVVAYARFLTQERPAAGEVGSHRVEIVRPLSASHGRTQSDVSPYRVIRMRFLKSCYYARMMGAVSDMEVVDEGAYDWSRIPVRPEPQLGQTVQEYTQAFDEAWRRFGLCPNPRMYDVQGSPWLRELQIQAREYKHYLILGHDAYVDVVAQAFEWALAEQITANGGTQANVWQQG